MTSHLIPIVFVLAFLWILFHDTISTARAARVRVKREDRQEPGESAR